VASLADIGSRLVAEAKKFIGDPYVYGAAGPRAFDCSGLVYYSLRQLGDSSVPRTSEEQYKWAKHINYGELQPGDLIFMQFPGDNAPPGHVVIYAGNGKIIQAPQPGQDVQEISWKPSDMAAWGGRIVGYGRIPGASGAGSSGTSGGSPALGLATGISQGLETVPGFGGIGQGISTLTGVGQVVGDIATAIQGIATDLGTFMHFFLALWRPSLWLRIGAFFGGMIAIGLAIWAMAKALDIPTPSPSNMPMVVPV
jgi:NlpC/P60 family